MWAPITGQVQIDMTEISLKTVQSPKDINCVLTTDYEK